MKKLSALLIVAMVFWASDASAQVTTIRIGDFSFTNGNVGGQDFNSTTTRIGGFSSTTFWPYK
jgi:hypothetical protein